MLIFLAFLFLLTPFPTLQASVGERKDSSKPAPHSITTLLNIKSKTPTLSPASKINNVSQTLFPTTMPPETPSVKKTSKDKSPSSSPIKVVITEGCIQKESQKDTVNSSKAQETELNLKPGSPLVMTHHISLVPGSCTGSCEAEMAALKDRLEILEKEMSTLKKKCTLCSEVQCPNNCNMNGKCVNGKCVNGKCVCLGVSWCVFDCSKGANKETKVSSDSSTVKQETKSPWEQSKANNAIRNGKDKEQRHHDQASGPASVEKIPPSKDVPLNHNVTQSTEKKSNGTFKEDFKKKLSLSNVTSAENDKKPSQDSATKVLKEGAAVIPKMEKLANVTEELKGKDRRQHKGHEKNVLETTSTEKDKKTIRESVTLFKEGSSEKKMVEKDLNVTTSTEKDMKAGQDSVTLLKEGSTEKKLLEKHSEATYSIEKGKKPSQGNFTQHKEGSSQKKIEKDKKTSQGNVMQPKEGSSEKKMVGKHSNITTSTEKNKKAGQDSMTLLKVEKLSNVTTSIEKDRKLRQSNNLPKDGSLRKRKVERFLNVGNNKDKKFVEEDETTINKKVTSGNKKGETHADATASTEKDKKLDQGNVTPLKEASLVKTKVDKHLNVTNSTEKDRKNQSKVTPLKEKTSGMRNVTTASEKRKMLQPRNDTRDLKFTLGNKAAQKHVNNSSIGKDNKLHQGNVISHKDESSGKTKLDRHLRVTISIEKDKKLLQGNETKVLNDITTEKKRLEKYLNVTTLTGKDKKLYKSNSTLIKEGTSQKGKVEKVNVNVKKSSEKGKKFLQGDETTVLTKVISVTEAKDVNTTTTSEKDKSLHHSLKEDASRKNKVNRDLKNITISKTHADRITKSTGIGSVEVHNITATGFVITWEAPQGLFRNFTVTREVWSGRSSEEDAEEAEKSQGDELYSANRTLSKIYTGKAEGAEKFSQVLAGNARSYHFKNLQPQRKYSVSLFSSGPHVRSKVHRLFVSTGPEPPTELLFSNITETSLTVSWTKPKSIVTGFKVTYTNSANGVTGSMFVDSQLSHVLISKLSVGTQYEISVRSVMGAIESEATTASVVTVPDSPTDLQAVNVTDNKGLLVWKPAQAKVDHYILSYGSTRSPNVTVTVMLSGTSVEHQLRGLQRSTLYVVKIMSQINRLQSSSVSTTFTTKSGVKLQVVAPSIVTWNSALISWKTTHLSFRSYRLTYQFEEEVKVKEVILNPTVSQYKLTDLKASSHYTVKVDGESEGQYINVVSTAFTTAQLPYPRAAECSQVQVNGMKKSGVAEIYPEGKEGEAVWVYCDLETDGGGWTVFQRRVDGSTDFFREWKDYSKGFGEISAEFWLGNDILHALTSMEPMSLRIDLHLENETAYAHYSNFSVGSEVNHYAIDLSGYSGTAGDSMRYHNGCPFSTKDKGPSTNSVHCAKKYMGGWWYKNCYKANLNGDYATFTKDQGVVWIDWKGKDISLPFTEMKLRPALLSHVTQNTQG